MGCFKLLVLMGRGGGEAIPPPFLFVKTIEKVIRLCTVLMFYFLNGSFEEMGIFHVFQLSFVVGGIISIHNR